MVATMSVGVSPSTLFALMERQGETGAPIDPAEAVDAAIHLWLATTCAAPPVTFGRSRAILASQCHSRPRLDGAGAPKIPLPP